MDTGQQVQLIEGPMDALEGMQVSDDQSAREALTHVLVTVTRMNQLVAQAHAQAMMGAGRPPMTFSASSASGLTASSAP
jgi:hypothetical protein